MATHLTQSKTMPSQLLSQMQAANDIVQDLVKLSAQHWHSPTGSGLNGDRVWLQPGDRPREIAEVLVQAIVSRLGTATAQVWLYEPNGQYLESAALAGLVGPSPIQRLYPDDTPLGQVVRRGQPLLSNHPDREPWILNPEWTLAQGLKGFAAYPINWGSERVGGLSIFSYQTLEAEFLEVLKFVCSYTASAIVNARLVMRTQQQADRAALMNRITGTVHQSLHWDQIVSMAVNSLQETLNLSRCCFYILNEDACSIRVTHEARHSDLEPAVSPYTLSEFGSACRQISLGEVVQFSSLDCDEGLCADGKRILQSLQIQAGVIIPVYPDPLSNREEMPSLTADPAGVELIGLVGAFKRMDYSWQPEEVELLQAVAHQLAIALTQAQLFAHARQQTERLTLLHSMTAVIRSSLDPATLFHAITQQIGEAFQVDVCTLALWQPEESCLLPVGLYAPQLTAAQLEEVLPGLRLIADPTLPEPMWSEQLQAKGDPGFPDSMRLKFRHGTQWLLATRAPVILSNREPVKGMESMVKVIPDLDPKASGLLLVPLLEGESLIGSLSLKRLKPDPGWQLADLELAQAVAEQAAIAIAQARLLTQTQHLLRQTQQQAATQALLFEKTTQQARREALLNEITSQIRTSLDPDRVLQSIVQSLATTLELDRCEISLYRPEVSNPAQTTPPTLVWSNGQFTHRINPLTADPLAAPTVMMTPPRFCCPEGSEGMNPIQPEIIEILQQGQPFVIADTQSEDLPLVGQKGDWLRAQFAKGSVRSLALIPILQSGARPELYGAIALIAYPEVRHFQADELSLAMAAAEQAGIALQHAQLYAQTRASALRESLLREIAQRLSSTYDPVEIVQIALEGMANALGVDRCDYVSLLDPADLGSEPNGSPSPVEGLKIQQEYCRFDSLPSSLGKLIPPDVSWLILLDCYGRHDSLLIDDVLSFPLPSQVRSKMVEAQIRAILCVPVLIDSQTVAGVLCALAPFVSEGSDQEGSGLNERSQRLFSEADTELVQAIADMTAVALQRTQYYERARQQAMSAAAVRGLTEGREAESRRLAADLHDQTLADLGALSRQLQQLTSSGEVGSVGRHQLETMDLQLRETIAELRGVVEDLQPTAMRAFNLGPALRSLLERAAQRSPQPLLTRFDDRSDTLLTRLDPVVQSTVFRIVQEALTNIVKHAQAHRIDLSILPIEDPNTLTDASTTPDPQPASESTFSHLELKIIDDGMGMPTDPDQVGRHGLSNMRYRAELIGGSIEWRARRSGCGTVVMLWIPLPE